MKGNKNILPMTTRDIQIMLSDVFGYYQLKTDTANKILKCVTKLENGVVKNNLTMKLKLHINLHKVNYFVFQFLCLFYLA